MIKRSVPIAWHYPRTALARAYLGTLDARLISSVVLFAPRRKAKAEFLLEDLLPAAEVRSYVIVYCSMWRNRSDPLAALWVALSQTRKPRSLGAKLQRRLLRPFKKTKVELEPHEDSEKRVHRFFAPSSANDV